MGGNTLYEKNMINKKGATFGGWTEAIVLSAMFMILLGTVMVSMNGLYSQDHGSTFGLDSRGVIDSYIQLQSTVESGVDSGEADFDSSSGLQISTLWTLVKATWKITGSFITGGWIEQAALLAQLPPIVGEVLRLLYLLSIGFILIKLLLKLKP